MTDGGRIGPAALLRGLVVCGLLTGLMGCALAGALAEKTGLGPPEPPQYVPQREPMLVFVENYRFPSLMAAESETLARLVTDELRKYDIAPVVEPETAYDLRSRDPAAFQAMSLADVGQKVGAEQVMYVDIIQSTLDQAIGSGLVRGKMLVRVKVIDAASGTTLFPEDIREGAGLSFETPRPMTEEASNVHLVRQQLHRGMAQDIVRLFREWKPDEPSAVQLE